jgi:hypothetical protein
LSEGRSPSNSFVGFVEAFEQGVVVENVPDAVVDLLESDVMTDGGPRVGERRNDRAKAFFVWIPDLVGRCFPIRGTEQNGSLRRTYGKSARDWRAVFPVRKPGGPRQWYQDNLGVSLVPESYEKQPWKQEAGPTALAPFPANSEYFGNPKKVWMVNFRVRDLDAMAAQLRAAGIA